MPPRSAAVLAGVLLLLETLILLTSRDPRLGTPTFGLIMLTLQVVGIVTCIRAATRRWLSPAVRRPWAAMTGLFVLTLLVVLPVAGGSSLDPTSGPVGAPAVISAVSRLLQYPLIIGVLLALPTRRMSRSEATRFWLDLVTVAGGTTMVSWYLVLGRLVSQHDTTTWFFLNPLGGLLVLFTIWAVLLRGVHFEVRRSMVVLLSGVSVFTINDGHLTYNALQTGDYHAVASLGSVMAVVLGAYLLTAAALVQCWPPEEPPRQDRHQQLRRVTWLPYGGLTVGFLTLAVAASDTTYPWAGLVAGAVLMTGAVVGRQVVAMREVHRLGVTDDLTGLANRLRFRERLEAATTRSTDDCGLAVLLLDLDHFKRLNDHFGHAAGDNQLVRTAAVLRACVGPDGLAARLGGDEFAVLLPRLEDPRQARVLADLILAVMQDDATDEARQVQVHVSIGIAWTDRDGDVTSEELLRRADMAMYTAKRAGGRQWREYLPVQGSAQVESALLEQDLRVALEYHELAVEYQPVIDLVSGEVRAVEALVRWTHRDRGAVPLSELLPVAEASGLIHELGRQVLQEAATVAQRLRQLIPRGEQLLDLSVNVSPAQLSRPGFADQVREVLDGTGLPATALILEITDSGAVQDPAAVEQLHQVRDLGVRIALDDFGTGHASLEGIARLPVDILKLDQCFITDLDGQTDRRTLAEAVIRLAQVLRLDVVAKGVEHAGEARELALLGYPAGQGYHLARPLSRTALTDLISAGRPWSSLGAGSRDPGREGSLANSRS